MSTKKLTLRQAKQTEFFSEYNFIISYQSGKRNDKANTFTCKLNKQPVDDNDEKLKYQMQTLLPPKQFKYAIDL